MGAAPSFVQTAQLARSSAAQDWAMETGMGTDVDRFLANSPAEYLTLGENEVMDAPAVITYTYQPGTPAGDRLYLEAKAGSTCAMRPLARAWPLCRSRSRPRLALWSSFRWYRYWIMALPV